MTHQNAGAFADQITDALLRELTPDPEVTVDGPGAVLLPRDRGALVDAVRRLLLTGTIRPAANTAVVSEALTARDCARLAAECLADARTAATEEPCEDAPDRSGVLVHVAGGYRQLGEAIAANMVMQPADKGDQDR